MSVNPVLPSNAHHALVQEAHIVLDRFAGMPGIEKIAILSQVLGHLITELPNTYGPGEVMGCIAANIAQGNQQTAQALASVINGAVQ